ncbi:MAG TPA: WS/DGAT domain-containing protein, partial [Solirubrobacterales bacterium]|nr:WS/DGAT domain-containing protein [Solirubrobacterales bacterium]
QPLYLLGRRIKEIYPFVPLSPQNHALSIGMISYDGRIYFGLAGDRDAVPDLDDLASALREALRELPVPRATPATRKRPPAKPATKRARAGAPGGKTAAKRKAGPKKKSPPKRRRLRARIRRRRSPG